MCSSDLELRDFESGCVFDTAEFEIAQLVRPATASNLLECSGGSGHPFLAESMVVRIKNTGMLRGRQPATIHCGPTRLTDRMLAAG